MHYQILNKELRQKFNMKLIALYSVTNHSSDCPECTSRSTPMVATIRPHSGRAAGRTFMASYRTCCKRTAEIHNSCPYCNGPLDPLDTQGVLQVCMICDAKFDTDPKPKEEDLKITSLPPTINFGPVIDSKFAVNRAKALPKKSETPTIKPVPIGRTYQNSALLEYGLKYNPTQVKQAAGKDGKIIIEFYSNVSDSVKLPFDVQADFSLDGQPNEEGICCSPVAVIMLESLAHFFWIAFKEWNRADAQKRPEALNKCQEAAQAFNRFLKEVNAAVEVHHQKVAERRMHVEGIQDYLEIALKKEHDETMALRDPAPTSSRSKLNSTEDEPQARNLRKTVQDVTSEIKEIEVIQKAFPSFARFFKRTQ